ncbi:TetR/AcrR family transcriptional regulator [Rhodococcus sp. NPDC056743]|uniref:TetR/AcrR family transcriptional regulator n=1 Tax=Rhodococcus sp. NPDC056743 TaxID=3345934 RepID=UPI00366F234C
MGRPTAAGGAEADSAPRPGKSRDAGNTRRLLLESARRRFARDGYAATTVRDIAQDAGVNVALISRYFSSKEGLFEACLRRAVEDLDQPTDTPVSVNAVIETMIGQVSNVSSGENDLQLLLLLRSSGDDRADQIRRDTLRSFAERLAAVAGWHGNADDEHILLQAQIALAASLGIIMLRSTTALEPLTSATAETLRAPFGEILSGLLSPAEKPRH